MVRDQAGGAASCGGSESPPLSLLCEVSLAGRMAALQYGQTPCSVAQSAEEGPRGLRYSLVRELDVARARGIHACVRALRTVDASGVIRMPAMEHSQLLTLLRGGAKHLVGASKACPGACTTRYLCEHSQLFSTNRLEAKIQDGGEGAGGGGGGG